jgi:hypothetical protein
MELLYLYSEVPDDFTKLNCAKNLKEWNTTEFATVSCLTMLQPYRTTSLRASKYVTRVTDTPNFLDDEHEGTECTY